MSSELNQSQRHIRRFLLIHLIITIVLPFFFAPFRDFWNYFVAALAGALLLGIVDRSYGRYLFWSFVSMVYLIKEIIVSNFVLAWVIIQPRPKFDPGIIAIPLTVTTGLEITVLSLAIAVTPGTLVLELGRDPKGHYVLYVHSFNVGDPDKFRATIKGGFERMILQISRGATV